MSDKNANKLPIEDKIAENLFRGTESIYKRSIEKLVKRLGEKSNVCIEPDKEKQESYRDVRYRNRETGGYLTSEEALNVLLKQGGTSFAQAFREGCMKAFDIARKYWRM